MSDACIYVSGELPALGDIVEAAKDFGKTKAGDRAQVIKLCADGWEDCIDVQWLTPSEAEHGGWLISRFKLISRVEAKETCTTTAKHKCHCSWEQVYKYGCICGGV
jgi:hypothetical protein